jgi:DNA-directed RNA polymerase specialized sigma24 family protein
MLKHSRHQLSIDEIIQGCQDESTRPRSQETGYCFELFRRALEEQEQAAWQAIDKQYRRLIRHWVHNCSTEIPREKAEEIVPDALPKFWYALTNSATPLTERFSHIGAILNYLKQCTISVFHEHQRQHHRTERIKQRLETPQDAGLAHVDPEEELLSRIDQERLLQLVQNWVKTYVTDVQEQRVLFLSYEQGLTPTEIAQHYPSEFADAPTVRRVKERVLKRARRALAQLEVGQPNDHHRNGATVLNQNTVIHAHRRQEVLDD